MAKYSRPRGGDVVVQTKFCGVGEGGTFAPVIVLPEADWRRLVEAFNRVKAATPESYYALENIDAIIQRTEAENA